VLGKVLSVVIAALATVSGAAQGQQYRAKQVEAINGVVECNWARDRLITVISGPCDDFTPPSVVRIGETFSANGKNKIINVVLAMRVEKDMPKFGVKAGDWYCAAAETSSDIPTLSGKREHTGTWLYIPKCVPIE
jgi:hypothetical protein